jgi:signal transduction histidine kinase
MPQQDQKSYFTNDDQRLVNILEMIARVAALDFSMTLEPSTNNDMLDAISVGLNMLSEELNTRVVEKSRLDEVNGKLEKFAYMTAHDLKSPMNSIVGIVSLIELSLDSETKSHVSEYLVKLKTTVDKMKSLVQGILDYSKVDSEKLEREENDLNKILFEILDTDQFFHQVNTQVIGSLPRVFFNTSAIQQVMRNLISNAVKYCDKEICELTITSVDLIDHHQICIADNGPGIAAENHAPIFELFNKIGSHPNSNSHGIGLATIKRVLETAGEKIWVESTPGNGARFYFTVKKSKPDKSLKK